jgi:hypothetical protein
MIELALPSSWFDEQQYPNPLTDHPLFTRYIPEVRERTQWPVPAINVRAEKELEPDGYSIRESGRVLEEGYVLPDHRYCARETIELLPPPLAKLAEDAPGLDLVRLPAGAVLEDELASALTMDAAEVVAHRVAEVVRPGGEDGRRSGVRGRVKLPLKRGRARV